MRPSKRALKSLQEGDFFAVRTALAELAAAYDALLVEAIECQNDHGCCRYELITSLEEDTENE